MFLSEYNSFSRFFKHSLGTFLALLLLAACSPEDDALPGGDGDNTAPAALRIEVSASDFTSAATRSNAGSNNSIDGNNAATRATDNGAVTTFESGDRIGITVLDGSGNVLSDNIPYKYNGSAWSFDNANGEGKTALYYDNKATAYVAYFPYSPEADGITGADIPAALKAQFPPRYDQRTEDAYRASDLLVWSNGTGSVPLKTLEIEFTHAYSSLSLSPSIKCKIDGKETSYTTSSVDDVSFTIGTEPLLPYRADDGSYRIIVSPQTTDARWFCSYKAKTYGGTMPETALAANNRHTLAPTLKDIGAYTFANAQVGDFYCKNDNNEGYLIPGDASLTEAVACIGIVYSTDVNRIGTAATQALKKKGVNTPHGLVMALTNASEGCRWGELRKDENSGGADGEPFKANTDKLQKQYNNVDGYAETHWIIDTYGRDGNTALKNTYTAFYHASRYGTAESSTGKYAAPSKTTGWFIPSMGQWWDILSNLGKIDLTSYRDDTGSYTYISGAAPIAVANMNRYLEKISGATPFSTDTWFWSSSEYNGYNACYVYSYSNGSLYLYYNGKERSVNRVRCSFAF
ncbi:fimbrillin family protein [Bacteroides fluxus]|uniref:fimbrillin family protein n=1 Tax=Bacteroides fluxus TaxID=626930 RepID=UPI00266C3755|nr:fimbrillin family protein [Bacteroides fluxus]